MVMQFLLMRTNRYGYGTFFQNTNQRPSLTPEYSSFQYFDTTLNKPIWWTGTKWVDSIGIDADSGSWITIE